MKEYETTGTVPVRETVVETPEETVVPEAKAAKKKAEKKEEVFDIGVTNLFDWFVTNYKEIEDCRQVKSAIAGVDPKSFLIYTLPKPNAKPDEKGEKEREVFFFKNPLSRPLLNLKPVLMDSYNLETFRIIYPFDEGCFIKAYGIKTGLIVTLCLQVEDIAVPYKILKVNRMTKGIHFVKPDAEKIIVGMKEVCDVEALNVRYPQLTKISKEQNTTNESAIRNLLNRQKTVSDINHHLKIDEIVILTLGL